MNPSQHASQTLQVKKIRHARPACQAEQHRIVLPTGASRAPNLNARSMTRAPLQIPGVPSVRMASRDESVSPVTGSAFLVRHSQDRQGLSVDKIDHPVRKPGGPS